MKGHRNAIAAALLLALGTAGQAQDFTPPTLDTYPDEGQLEGMTWNYLATDNGPYLGFEVPETDFQLWRFDCEAYGEERHVVGNTLLVTPRNMKAGDRFGMTVRVDKGNSYGIVARMDKVEVEGEASYAPYFRLTQDHGLWEALRRGSRAFIDVGDRRFSIHLNGSGKAIKSFLDGCGS